MSKVAEFDIYQDGLQGLAVVDIEFSTVDEKKKFVMPEFCLVDITQEEFIAGGKLAGRSYGDIELDLARLSYKEIETL